MKHLMFATAIMLISLAGFSAIAQNRPTAEDRAKTREDKRKQIEAQKQAQKQASNTDKQLGNDEKSKYLEAQKTKGATLLTEKQKKTESENKTAEEMRNAKLKLNEQKGQINNVSSSEKGKYLLKEETSVAEMKPEEKKKYLLDKVENGNLTDEQKLAIKIKIAEANGEDVSQWKKVELKSDSKIQKNDVVNKSKEDVYNLDNPKDPEGLSADELKKYHIEQKKLAEKKQGKE